MSTFIKIAWRNIIRNKRRSLITISAIGFGLGALILILSFVEGAHRQMIENYTSLVTSHIQVHQKDFHQKKKLELNISNPNEIVSQLKKIPSIQALALRIKAIGLLSSSESSAGVLIMGVFPEDEKSVSTIHKRLREGEFLKKDSDENIVIGASLAKNLNVHLGDKIVIMSQAMDGSIAAGAYYIQGIFDTGTDEVDQGIVFITHHAAEELFVLPEKTSEIAIRVASAQDSPAIADQIAATLSRPDLEVLPWQKISPSFQQWIEFDNNFIWLIVFVVMIIVGIGILNTILMGVLERTREFGILIAIGTKQKEIVAIIGWESIFLALLGSTAGILIGGGLTFFLGKIGINLSLFTAALNSLYIDSVIYPKLNMDHTLLSLSLVLITSILVSIYPAFHAARLKPIDAIRSI